MATSRTHNPFCTTWYFVGCMYMRNGVDVSEI